jgi:hypothetical protein
MYRQKSKIKYLLIIGSLAAALLGIPFVSAQIGLFQNKTFNGIIDSGNKFEFKIQKAVRGKGEAKVEFFKDEPSITLHKWDSEVALHIAYKKFKATAEKSNSNRVEWKAEKEEIHAYTLDAKEGMEDGGLEVEVFLKQKPDTNQFDFALSGAENLNFHYQSPLNEANLIGKKGIVSCTETECIDKDGKVINSRPENVIGSYAVYHKEKKNDYSQVGGNNYGTGKAFHIYRPQITDAAGNKVWGKLHVNERTGDLSVTVPQGFLDTAVYPVIVDPTFGYAIIGASTGSISGPDLMEGVSFPAPADASTVTGLTFYSTGSTGGINFKAVAVKQSDLTILTNGISNVGTVPNSSGAWGTVTFPTPPSITPSTNYIFMLVTDAAGGFSYQYDSIAAYTNYFDNSNSYATPTDPIDASTAVGDFIWSMYITYASSGTYPYWVGTGAQVAAANDSSTLSPALPTGWAAGDLFILVIAGRPESVTPSAFTVNNWTQQGSTVVNNIGGSIELSLEIWYRVAQGGDVAPTVTPSTDYTCVATCTTTGYSAFIAAYRNVDTSSPFDANNVTSTSAAATTWTPTAITTNSNFALVLSVVATSDDNALELDTANGFNTNAGAASYDTVTGSDHSSALADYVKATLGAVTMPVWRENVLGTDAWVGITAALKPLAAPASPIQDPHKFIFNGQYKRVFTGSNKFILK